MEARDFRGLGRAAQEALRRRVLFLIAREGMTQTQAALAVGVHRQTVNIWHKCYRERGEEGVLDGRRVSPWRGAGLLTAEEANKVRGWLAGQAPDSRGSSSSRANGGSKADPLQRANRACRVSAESHSSVWQLSVQPARQHTRTETACSALHNLMPSRVDRDGKGAIWSGALAWNGRSRRRHRSVLGELPKP